MIYLSGLACFFETTFLSCITFIDRKEQISTYKRSFFNANKLLNEVNVCDSLLIDFSWSGCLFVLNGHAYLCGYLNGKSGQTLKLATPDKGFIIQGTYGRINCNFVTREGAYWLYNRSSSKWKNIGQLLGAEKSNDDASGSDLSETKLFVVKIACGDHTTFAVTATGNLYSVPSLVVLPGLKVTDIVCGKEHALMLTNLCTVYTCGNGSRGQLGHGELEGEEHPMAVVALSGLKVMAISAGGWHSCCLTDEGDLYSWGWNSCGQLGFPAEQSSGEGKTTSVSSVLADPKPVDWPAGIEVNVKQVSCGARHTIALLEDKTVWGCGWNSYNQLQESLPENVFCMTKLNLPFDQEVKKVVCGEWNSAFIT